MSIEKLIKTKIAWIDLETTGLDPEKNDIWQLAVLIEQDGKIIDEGEWFFRPLNEKSIAPDALTLQEDNPLTVEYLMSLPERKAEFAKFKRFIARHVNKYNKKDKMVPAGYFVRFDLDFLRSAFDKSNDPYFGSWFFTCPIAVESFVGLLVEKGFRFENHKLKTVCDALGIKIAAHDALSDIKATRTLFQGLKGLII